MKNTKLVWGVATALALTVAAVAGSRFTKKESEDQVADEINELENMETEETESTDEVDVTEEPVIELTTNETEVKEENKEN